MATTIVAQHNDFLKFLNSKKIQTKTYAIIFYFHLLNDKAWKLELICTIQAFIDTYLVQTSRMIAGLNTMTIQNEKCKEKMKILIEVF